MIAGNCDEFTSSAPEAGSEQKHVRLVSLDAFRGFTILGMLLVNNMALGVATPRQLTHAAWNEGVNFADLVFPWFLYIVGVALPFSFTSHKSKGLPTWSFCAKAVRRTALLVLLGCLIDSSLIKRPVFDLGVLQLIGLAFLVGALLYPLRLRFRLTVAALFLLAHWAAIRFLPVPGVGSGVFTESVNLITYLNHTYLQSLHLKGIISVVPTSALIIIGSGIGDLIRDQRIREIQKTVYMGTAGLFLGVLGFLWNLDLPFNKPVWTASYILLSAGLASVVLALLYLMVDCKGWKSWVFPLVVFGSNAIVAYVLPILVKVYILRVWTWDFADGNTLSLQDAFLRYLTVETGPIAGGWLYTMSYTIVWWLVLLYLYRRKFFLRV